jgi:hypothetical protein
MNQVYLSPVHALYFKIYLEITAKTSGTEIHKNPKYNRWETSNGPELLTLYKVLHIEIQPEFSQYLLNVFLTQWNKSSENHFTDIAKHIY